VLQAGKFEEKAFILKLGIMSGQEITRSISTLILLQDD
jgi:hypothetical protein